MSQVGWPFAPAVWLHLLATVRGSTVGCSACSDLSLNEASALEFRLCKGRPIFHQNAWLNVPMIQLRTHTAQTRRWWEHGSPHNTTVSVIANRGKSLPTPAQETAHHMREARPRIPARETHASLSV